VVVIPSSHIYRGPRRNLNLEDFLIDIGARSKAEVLARGVEILDPVTAVKDIAVLSGGRVAGPMLSRKMGAFALLAALQASAVKPGKGVIFAWAAQGNRRNSGVARLARVYGAKKVLLVGAYTRLEDRKSGVVKDPVETLGSGVLVPEGGSPEGGGDLLRALSAAAPGLGVRLTPSATGELPEVTVFREAKADVVPISIAVKYPGSLTEVIDAADLEQLIRIIRAAAEM
jgi:putative aminopeptidase FrvX